MQFLRYTLEHKHKSCFSKDAVSHESPKGVLNLQTQNFWGGGGKDLSLPSRALGAVTCLEAQLKHIPPQKGLIPCKGTGPDPQPLGDSQAQSFAEHLRCAQC